MSIDEAKKILVIMTTADDKCHCCARNLMKDFIKKFPEYKDIAENIYKEEFALELFEK